MRRWRGFGNGFLVGILYTWTSDLIYIECPLPALQPGVLALYIKSAMMFDSALRTSSSIRTVSYKAILLQLMPSAVVDGETESSTSAALPLSSSATAFRSPALPLPAPSHRCPLAADTVDVTDISRQSTFPSFPQFHLIPSLQQSRFPQYTAALPAIQKISSIPNVLQ